MKRLLFLLIVCPTISFAQEADTTVYYHIRKHASIASAAPHKRMVWFTNQYFSATVDFQFWLQENQNWFFDESQSKELVNNGVRWIFKRRYAGNPQYKPSPLVITVNGNADKETIKGVEISGDWDAVSKLFIRYWSKPITIIEKYNIGEIAFVESFGDRVTLYYTSVNKGKIVIKPNNVLIGKKVYDPAKLF